MVVLCLAACSGDDDATGSDSSSGDGMPETSADDDSPTDPTMTDGPMDTTCADGCPATTESGSDTTTAVDGSTDTGVDDSTTTSESGESSSESSSEGMAAVCGNGAIEDDEECDDSVETAECDADCTFVDCGDEVVNTLAGEACDAGGESVACDGDCTLPECGDGNVNESADEVCDDAGSSATCDSDCTLPLCGDGTQNEIVFETCDDGNMQSGDGCSSNCVIEGDFGGVCRVVGDVQWCFDRDACGEACEDVCGALGLALLDSDVEWSAAQDTEAECQAISDAFGLADPIQFDASPLGCIEDGGLADLTGGGLTGGLLCSSDPACPAAHRTDMDGLGGICDLPGARRSVCPCQGQFCGNGVVEGNEFCDDGNDINGDGCNNQCAECGGVVMDPGNGIEGCWYTAADVNMSCTDVCMDHGGFDAVASQHNGNAVGVYFWPEKAFGSDWETVECSSTDNNTNWGANGQAPDPFFVHPNCYLNCACAS
jgi:cysteine-rich repeat protein